MEQVVTFFEVRRESIWVFGMFRDILKVAWIYLIHFSSWGLCFHENIMIIPHYLSLSTFQNLKLIRNGCNKHLKLLFSSVAQQHFQLRPLHAKAYQLDFLQTSSCRTPLLHLSGKGFWIHHDLKKHNFNPFINFQSILHTSSLNNGFGVPIVCPALRISQGLFTLSISPLSSESERCVSTDKFSCLNTFSARKQRSTRNVLE